MTCTQPIRAWQRPFYPINANDDDYGYTLKQLNKLSFKPIKGWTEIKLPCGRCLGCILDHASEWATRIYCEMKQWKHAYFITLTYNEKEIPKTIYKENTLLQNDMQNFFKKLRNKLKGEKFIYDMDKEKEINPIRYLYCGEIGPKTKRPHYHAIIFNIKLDDLKPYKQNKQGDWLYTSKTIQDIWGHGFVIIGNVTYESASYVARYCQKKAGITKAEKIIKNIRGELIGQPQPEFIRMSRMPGLGKYYWDENKEIIKKQNGIIVKTAKGIKHKPIPRFFMKLWEKEDMSEFDIKKYENKKIIEKHNKELLKHINYGGKWDAENEIRLHQEKMAENLYLKTKKALERNET